MIAAAPPKAPMVILDMPDGSVWENPYQPSAEQQAYHATTARYVLYGGARGGGKTRAEVEDIAATMLKWPGIPILVCRKDLQDLKRTVLVEWQKHIPEQLYDPKYGGQWHKTDNIYRFYNGSTLYMSEMKDVESWRSATLGRVYGDEWHEVPDGENTIRELNATLRWTTGEGECEREACRTDAREFNLEYKPHALHPVRQLKLATNPHGGYLKTKFYTPWKQGHQLPGHQYIPATVMSNPGADPSYIAGLMRNNPQWVKNFVYGDWEAFENMAYSGFSRATHRWRDPLPTRLIAHVEGGIDYGSTGTASHLSAMYLTAKLKDGRLITFWEYVEQGAPTKVLFAKIKEMQHKWNVRRWFADASQFIANGALRSAGIPVHDAPRYQGAVKDGVNLGNQIMEVDATGRPQWYVTDDCPRLMAGLESYSVDPVTGLYIKENDDEVDAWRYNIMSIASKADLEPATMHVTTRHPQTAQQGHRSTILRKRQEARSARLRAAMGE